MQDDYQNDSFTQEEWLQFLEQNHSGTLIFLSMEQIAGEAGGKYIMYARSISAAIPGDSKFLLMVLLDADEIENMLTCEFEDM